MAHIYGISILAGNPLKCDCSFLPFIRWLKTNNKVNTDIDVCFLPDSENSTIKQPSCPDVCSCKCVENEGVPFMLVDCSAKNFSSLPQFCSSKVTQLKVSNHTYN